MPIECSQSIVSKNQDDFYTIDFEVMGRAFDIHNRMGRFLNESIYNNSLTNACIEAGLQAANEVALKVSYKDFCKKYYLDILIENGIIYELKTCRKLDSNHKQQFDTSEWDCQNKDYNFFENILKELFADWGGFLDLNLYKEGIVHFLGGNDVVIAPINIIDNEKIVGQQKMPLLNKTTAFHFSAVTENLCLYKDHIKRILKHSNIKTVLMVNINKGKITLATIK